MKTTITLTEEQLALLLFITYSSPSLSKFEGSDKVTASEVLEILESAEKKITSLY